MTWNRFWQTCCASCTSVLGGEEEAEEEILMTMLIIIICLWLLFLLMHIFMFDSFQLLFDLFIFWILRMVITGSAKLVVTLKTTAFSVHSCLTQNVTSLLGGIHFKWSLEHNFCLTSLTSSPSGIISGLGSACVFNLTSFSWNATLVLCHISKATCHHTSLNFFSLHAQLYCSQLSLWLNRL